MAWFGEIPNTNIFGDSPLTPHKGILGRTIGDFEKILHNFG